MIVTDTNKLGSPSAPARTRSPTWPRWASLGRRDRRRRSSTSPARSACGTSGSRSAPARGLPLRREPGGRRDQDHRRRGTATPTASTSSSRAAAQDHAVLPLSRHLGPRPGEPVQAAGPGGTARPRERACWRTRCRARTPTAPTETVTIGGATLPLSGPRRRPSGEDARGDPEHDPELRRPRTWWQLARPHGPAWSRAMTS